MLLKDWRNKDEEFFSSDRNAYSVSACEYTLFINALFLVLLWASMSNTDLIRENDSLRHIIKETLPYARRYCDNRCTFAPSVVNECIDIAKKYGIELEPDKVLDDRDYAKDGMLGSWNPASQRFVKNKAQGK